MKWTTTRNCKPVSIKSIPVIDILPMCDQIIRRVREGMRLISFFGTRQGGSIVLYAVLADDENSRLSAAATDLGKRAAYPSLSAEIPSAWNFENEFYEEFGILPEGHPWLKPVRYGSERSDRSLSMKTHPFFSVSGEQVHEVAVGPVHAGVIEPGHFRFMCQGEQVHHLEIQLGYQHRGVERLFLENRLRFPIHLAESIAGDSVIAHGSAFAQAMEGLAGAVIPRRAQSIRAIALEMERAAIHIGGLAAIAGDVAYLLGNAVYGAARTLVINALMDLCGSRFGRGLVRVGGVAFDIDGKLRGGLEAVLEKTRSDVERMSEEMFSSASVLSRLEQTGIVDADIAAAIGLVGPAAKASGVARDVRADHPFGIYRNYPVHTITMNTGDVFARAYIRYVEINQSINIIRELLADMSDDRPLMTPVNKIPANSFVVSLTEGWRGEVVHAAITGKGGCLSRYKVKDPSFNNWFGLAQAMRGNGISDFPLCNKSFDLSYCGNDL